MAKQSRRGYRAPANYEPNRKRGAGKRRFHGGDPRRGEQPAPKEERDRRQAAGDGRARDAAEARSTGRQDRDRDRDPRPARADEVVPERLEAKWTSAADVAGLSFADLGLGGNIIRTLGELGAEAPFPVQAATIPDALAGRDVLGRARTGSGKTIAFGAALVERLLQLKAEGAFAGDPVREKRPKRGERGARVPRKVRNPKALILAPTRELALQIDATVQPIARSVGLYTAQLVGGVPIDPQLHALERGIDIVIGTPGRMQDLVNRRRLDLREVVVSVVDEADHMCDLGFLEPVQKLLRQTVRGGQRLLFSATLDQAVSELVREFLRDPAVHEIVEEGSSSTEHRVHIVLREHKAQVLEELVRGPGRIMVFCRTRAYATSLAEAFAEAGIRAVPLHGDLSQSKRERNLERFASGKANVLVATDVAARGIHVDDVDLVLQADPPDDHKTYLHRAGRTGRAGKPGLVITVIPRTRQKRTREMLELAQIEPSCFDDYPPRVD